MKTLLFAFICQIFADQLLKLIVLQRHGPRFPLFNEFCENHPKLGLLSEIGVLKHVEKANEIALHYKTEGYAIDTLPMIVKSSDFERCIDSAKLTSVWIKHSEQETSEKLVEMSRKFWVDHGKEAQLIVRGYNCKYMEKYFDHQQYSRQMALLN